MFESEGGLLGQNQSEHCLNLEIHTEKWTVPNAFSHQRFFFEYSDIFFLNFGKKMLLIAIHSEP